VTQPFQSHWSFELARLARAHPRLTDDDRRCREREGESFARLQEPNGAWCHAPENFSRVEDEPSAGAGDGLYDDAGLRGSCIPENTSQSGLSGI
jgi:hypothetical protein